MPSIKRSGSLPFLADFVYLDGVVADCGYCHIDEAALLADSLKRLGSGMHLFISAGPPSMQIGCPFESLTEIAPYVRVGSDTVDSWAGSVLDGFSQYTRLTAPSIAPHHFGDLASLLVGRVHCKMRNGNGKGRICGPGPDYTIPSNQSSMTEDEVYSYTSMVAIFRSTWWPSGVLSEMDDFMLGLLTKVDVIRITMNSMRTRQVIDAGSKSFAGPGVVWTSDDSTEAGWKYVLLVNLGPAESSVSVRFVELGIEPNWSCAVQELWGRQHLLPADTATAELTATLQPHASVLVKLSQCTAAASAASVATVKTDDKCAVVDVSNTATLHEAQRQARAAGASAPCVRVLLGQRVFRLAEPLVLSAADSHTTFVGGEITTAVDVPASAWNLPAERAVGGSTASSPVAASLEVSRLVNSSEWGKVDGSATSSVPGEHLSLLVQVAGVWRPMTVARWPNIPFDYGDVPPVNWTTISATCPCAGAPGPGGGCGAGAPSSACGVNCSSFQWADDTDRPARWVTAAEEGRLFIHGFFKYLWRDHFAPITKVDVANRRLSTNASIGSTSGVTNDSFYYAYGLHGEPRIRSS